MKVRDGAKLALLVAVCAACSSDYVDVNPAVDFDPIIGGAPATAYPEAAYLNIDMSPAGGFACSGTLIAPRVVLTAGHCVDAHALWDVYVGSAYRQTTSAAVYDWNENGSEAVNPKHHDVGLVFLSEPVNLASYPTLSQTKVADGTLVVNVGRVLDGDIRATDYQASALIKAGDSIGYPFDYTSSDVIQEGDSGGAVFLSGSHTIVAVNSGAGNGIQVLARTDLLYAWIAGQIATHGGSAPSQSEGAGGGTNTAANESTSPVAGASGATNACSGTEESEPNDTFSKASKLGHAECGELAKGGDVDFYAVTASAGTHTLAISASADAVLSVGVASGDTCVLSLSNVASANVTVASGTATLCVKASSPGKQAQSYAISFE